MDGMLNNTAVTAAEIPMNLPMCRGSTHENWKRGQHYEPGLLVITMTLCMYVCVLYVSKIIFPEKKRRTKKTTNMMDLIKKPMDLLKSEFWNEMLHISICTTQDFSPQGHAYPVQQKWRGKVTLHAITLQWNILQ